MDSWFDIIKTQRTVTDVGFDFDLPEEEEPEKDEDKFPCCEEARKKILQIINFREADFVKEAHCEDLYWLTRFLSSNKTEIGFKFAQIKSEWGNCVALLPQPHIEEKGWSTDYRDVE